MEIDLVAYLAEKGYRGRAAGGAEVVYPCFLSCGEAADSKKRKLYLNTETGLYTCFVCGSNGGSYLLQKHFGDDPKKPEPGEDPQTRRRILNWAADVGSAMLANNEQIMLYLMDERGLSPETIVEAKLGFVGSGWSLTGSLPEDFTRKELSNTGLVYRDGPRAGQDFFYQHILIPYVSRSGVQQMRGRLWGDGKGGKYMTGPGDPVLLYGADTIEGAEDVVITEGEFDRLALLQHLQSASDERIRKTAVVGLAGANGFKEGFENYFTEVKRVFIGLDPDDTGRREAVKIQERLGAKARILELPPELPKCDWSEYLLPVPADADEAWKRRHPHAGHTWHDVAAMLSNAAGKRVFSVREAAHSWATQKTISTGLKTGFKKFDARILPGLLPGQLMIVLAKTGTGKTVFLCNLVYNMLGEHVLFLSLEMTREEVYERLRRIYLFYHPRASDEEILEAYAKVGICDENRIADKEFESIVAEYEAEFGATPTVCLVDYLGYYARGQRGNSPYEKTTNAAMQLKAVAKKHRFAIISPSQVNRLAKEGKPIDLDDARDSGAVEETADFLLALWRPDTALQQEGAVNVQPSGQAKLSILKSRHGGKDFTVSLVMDALTLALIDEDHPLAKRVKDHNYDSWRGITYDELRAQETAPYQPTFKEMNRP